MPIFVQTVSPNKKLLSQQEIADDMISNLVILELGKKNPFRALEKEFERLFASSLVVVYADGKELAILRTHMKNLPWPIHSVEPVYWTGDDARFIAMNFEF